jgi:peptidoglycan/xylan/chitin deacetylase (PgdA/CDA1 family)
LENENEEVTVKRLVTCAIGMGFFAFTAIRTFLLRLVGRPPEGSCVVLYYHSIPGSQRQAFAKQLDMILHYATPTALTGNFQLRAGVHLAGVTFDDGFQDFHDHALPELEKRHIPAVMFVMADAAGKSFGPLDYSQPVMSLEQLRSLPEELVTIGSHTSTHPMLAAIGEEDARQEIVGSRIKLEIALNRKIELFSFPFGSFNQRLIEVCREAGYRRVFTTLPKLAFVQPDEFAVGRVRVDPTDWPVEFWLKLNGSYRWLPVAFRLKRSLFSTWPIRTGLKILRRTPRRVEPQSAIQEFSNR